MKKSLARIIRCLAAALACLYITGCEMDSGESATRNVDINVYGVYWGSDDYYGELVNNCSGSAPEYMDLRQTGDELEGIDNNGMIFSGTIGSVNSEAETCTVTLEGKTTTGNRVIISGHINISGSVAVMEGTWIEDNLYALFHGEATAPAQPTNTSISVTISSDPVDPGGTATLTASGGSGSYPTWAVAYTNYGYISSSSGSYAYYKAYSVTNVTQRVTVTDSAGVSASISFSQQ